MRLIAICLVFWFANPAFAIPIGVADDGVISYQDHQLLPPPAQVTDKAETRPLNLVEHAMGLLGVPYKRGGTSADTGFDCSGFIRSIYEKSAGLLLPRSAAQQAAVTEKIQRTDLKPGDLVFFNTMRRTFSHVGLYLGQGKFIHAPKPGAQVRIEDMGVRYWTRRFDGARRVAPTPTIPSTSRADASTALPEIGPVQLLLSPPADDPAS
jgi:hypothetical protein